MRLKRDQNRPKLDKEAKNKFVRAKSSFFGPKVPFFWQDSPISQSHNGLQSESEKAKTFRIVRFLLQKLSG